MKSLNDPAERKKFSTELNAFVALGPLPPAWQRKRGCMDWRYLDWELRVVIKALLQAGLRGDYSGFLAPELQRTPRQVFSKIERCGGRQAFMDKYGELVSEKERGLLRVHRDFR